VTSSHSSIDIDEYLKNKHNIPDDEEDNDDDEVEESESGSEDSSPNQNIKEPGNFTCEPLVLIFLALK
jgi:endogenous inhibitor of DNA gyrase (YacG/DUF329 family)